MKILSRNLVFLLLILLVLTGCWPGNFTKIVKSVPEKLDGTQDHIEKSIEAFNKFKSSEEYSEISKYDDLEGWSNTFTEANKELEHARSVYEKDVIPLLKKKKKDMIPVAKNHIERISASRDKILEMIKYPMSRANTLLYTKNNISEVERLAKSDERITNESSSNFRIEADKAKQDFPNKLEDLDMKTKTLLKLKDDALNSYKIVYEETKSSNPNIARLADAFEKGRSQRVTVKKTSTDFSTLVQQLYNSYTKTLIDMKIVEKPWIQLVTYRWSNYAEYDNTKVVNNEKRYLDTAEAKRIEKEFQRNQNGFIVDRGSDYEIWAENFDVEEEFYHRYAITTDGVRKVGNWELVSEKYFEENEDNLGMDLLSKPYGMYESEMLKQATPEGMALIGNKNTGRWIRDKSGNRYWEWYGKYAFYSRLFGGRRYYYSDWNHWNTSYRGRKSYYGRDDDIYGTYGRTTQSSSRYQKSSFGRKSNFKSQAASVRGAGRTSRGRGPGGGGK